jgi:hypothetical protein
MYFYSWIPLVIVGTVALLALPWLGLIALLVFALLALAALAALVWAIVAIPLAAGRAIGRRWQARSGAHRPSPTLSLAGRENAYVTIGDRRSGGIR